MTEKTEKPAGPSKSFMTVGPTLHYSHSNVRMYWTLGIIVYILACFFWSQLLTGSGLPTGWASLNTTFSAEQWSLGRYVLRPLSIFQYPWQIYVLGTIMGIIAVAPVLASQLLCFRYSTPMILACIFIAKLPLFALFILISCIAVASRPFRFRSRFIAIILCTSPQLLYWAIFGRIESVDPIRWAISYAPWIWAWLTAVAIAGTALAIGHFTRYRPGLVWSANGAALIAAFVIFSTLIGFSELDYELYIAGNNPEEIPQFHDQNIAQAIDKAMQDPTTRSYLAGWFYPSEPILLREYLKQEIQNQLSFDRWPRWFNVPDELNYQNKRQEMLNLYDLFIEKRPGSRRIPIALYYKAILNEFTPDLRRMAQSEVLHFYSDHPHPENFPIWYKLYNEFPDSRESIEARWRIAVNVASQQNFEKAKELCEVAMAMIDKSLQQDQIQNNTEGSFLAAFTPPPPTVITTRRFNDLKQKINEFIVLIGPDNRTDLPDSAAKLAQFIKLNPYKRDYADRLEALLAQTAQSEPLYDNLLLAKIKLITDTQLQAEQLSTLSDKFPATDAGITALYELALLKINSWKNAPQDSQPRNTYLTEARAVLENFIAKYPSSIYAQEAATRLSNLPAPP